MRLPAAVTAAGAALCAVACLAMTQTVAAEPAAPYRAEVVVVRARQACFAATVRVTGFLVARQEAVVSLDVPNMRVTEVLVGEGDTVKAGQELVRLTRQPDENARPNAALQTITLKSPARVAASSTVCAPCAVPTSAATGMIEPANAAPFATVSSSFSIRLPFAITVAPADANRSAVARPIPEPAPVTTTTCFVRSMAAPVIGPRLETILPASRERCNAF